MDPEEKDDYADDTRKTTRSNNLGHHLSDDDIRLNTNVGRLNNHLHKNVDPEEKGSNELYDDDIRLTMKSHNDIRGTRSGKGGHHIPKDDIRMTTRPGMFYNHNSGNVDHEQRSIHDVGSQAQTTLPCIITTLFSLLTGALLMK